MGIEDASGIINCGIYRIDLGNDWFYIGSSNNLRKRESHHRSALRRGVHRNKIAQRAYKKYGEFLFTVLGHYSEDCLLQQEQILLDLHRKNPKCVNVAITAGSPNKGRKFSAEHRAKMSIAQTGKKLTMEHREKLRAAKIGRKLSVEHCAALSVARKGKKRPPFSTEWRANISAARTGKRASDETRANMSAAQRRRPPPTEETRAKMSLAQSKRSRPSQETRDKMSAAHTERWRRAREAALKAL